MGVLRKNNNGGLLIGDLKDCKLGEEGKTSAGNKIPKVYMFWTKLKKNREVLCLSKPFDLFELLSCLRGVTNVGIMKASWFEHK